MVEIPGHVFYNVCMVSGSIGKEALWERSGCFIFLEGGFVLAVRRQKKKVVKMKRRQHFFTGTLLLIFAALLLFLFIQSLTREHVSIYEVTETQIADDEVIRGVIIRDESVVKTKKKGYVNYYVGEGAKIGANTVVYSIDGTGKFAGDISALEAEEISLSAEDTMEIRSDIADFRNSFDLSEYGSVTNFKYSIDNTLLKMTTVSLLEKLNKVMKKDNMSSSLELVKAEKPGIISFCSDGLENLSIDNITKKNFENMNDNWKQLRSAGTVKSGKAVYKLVNSEKWSIVLPLTEEQYKKVCDKVTVPVRLKKDNLGITADISTFIIDSAYYARLDFDKYMIRYLDNRYLDVEIEFNNAGGLKIPVSSIFEKEFYIVPEEYITKGGTDGGTGVMVLTYKKDGTKETTFKAADIIYKTKDGDAYIDAALFDAGTVIVQGTGNGAKSTQLAHTGKLEGVYNCNQGYCVFRRIEKLYSNDEYAVVSKDTEYGLSAYDHIILNPGMISEDDIIY